MPKPQERPCTYADYAAWPEGERWELIERVPWIMVYRPGPGGKYGKPD